MLNFNWLLGVSVGAAKSVFLVLFVLIAFLVFLVPHDSIYEGVDEPCWWHNLKLWAWLDLAFIFIVYVVF